jgi:nitrate/TMAO reductase-like tetraheme cytochrome c subunit
MRTGLRALTTSESQPPVAANRAAHLELPPTAVEPSSIQLVANQVNPSESERGKDRLPPLSAQDEATLATLPPACLSGLPGINMERFPSVDTLQRLPAIDPAMPEVKPQSVRPQFTSAATAPVANPIREFFALPPVTASPPHVEFSPEAAFSVYNPHPRATAERLQIKQQRGEVHAPENCEDPHAAVFKDTLYPSATECRKCHEQLYEEWAVSSHANAGLSPMFQKFEQKLNELAQGTLGYFCYRCHAPIATTEKFDRSKAVYDGPRVYREGVTCVVCHRVAEHYAKSNGERRYEPGGLDAPVYGSGDGLNLDLVLKYPEQHKVKTNPQDKRPGQVIHNRVIQFAEISQSTFCVSCHQVAVHPNIKLEVVWEQYRNSPAYRNGVRCQDCHMGKVPGVPAGFEIAHTAIVNEKPIGTQKRHSNHVFFGPGYAITHPGLFPQNPKADRWPPRQWLAFDWRAGWGTEAFEHQVERGEINPAFPAEWAEADDRMDAREILDANFKRLKYKDDTRRQVMENGSRIDGPFFSPDTQCADGTFQAGKTLKLHYTVTNTNAGHNMPTGSLGAQPQLWVNVVLVNPRGQRVWETGYLDTQGDLADAHSVDAQRGVVPRDQQLVNFQTKFLITNVKGTDREMPLPVNIDIDQIPFLRPAPQPVTVLNHPPFIRMEAHSIPPLGSRPAAYRIPGSALTEPGTYRLSIRMRSRGEPIYFMKFVGATEEMIRTMNEKILDVHPYTVTFKVR